MAGASALCDGPHDDAHAFGDREFLDDFPQAGALLGVLDLAGDPELLGERHQHQVAAGHGNVSRDAWPLGADRPLGNLNHNFRADRVDVRDVLGCDLALRLLLFALALDLLKPPVERGGDGVPEVQERILIEADVHEHGLESTLDVFDAAFENTADDVLVALALDGVFFEHAIF